MKLIRTVMILLAASVAVQAADIRPPENAVAGKAATLLTSGSGDATFYLVGPATAVKRNVQAGNDIPLHSDELQNAGRYVAVLCASGGCNSATFFVRPAAPNNISLLVHPSRVPVGRQNGISAVAFVFDNYHNLVAKDESVKFSIITHDGKTVSADRKAADGIAWVRISSARQQGTTKIGAAIGHDEEVRVVQQVAAEACNLRIKAEHVKGGVLVETDPVRDCSGNPVPDGTVVSFTKTDSAGKTTVDVPIKRSVAKVEMPVDGRARITVASGVVTGNELEISE